MHLKHIPHREIPLAALFLQPLANTVHIVRVKMHPFAANTHQPPILLRKPHKFRLGHIDIADCQLPIEIHNLIQPEHRLLR
ncbi:hypothetical protein D3C85_1857870 [compost metagenome]